MKQVVQPGPSRIPRIRCRGVGKQLPSGERELTILDGVDLDVAEGEFVAVLGPSGSGKSTLLGLMAGLDRPSSGEVSFEGRVLSGMSEDELAVWRRSHVGFVFQSFHLLPNFTALENVLLPLELIDAADAPARAEALLDTVGLADRSHHYPRQLSGGEQQRVAIARAFATRPALLLADEPTGNLDAETGERVLEVLEALRREDGGSLVLVTHDPAVARRADRHVHIESGRIVSDARTSDAHTSEGAA